MRALLSTFESTKGDLMVRLQNVSKEKQTEEKERQQLNDEIKHLKGLILKKDQEIEDQRRSIIDLD
jgi:predicted  nucleic acid-binding Zn-ribbon protein